MFSALAGRILDKLAERGATLATAESCTGGRIAAALTAVPGSSRVFVGAIVAYSNQVKIDLLGVSIGTLDEFGAVSEECAWEMARGAQERFGSGYAVAVTGIAGPDGGSDAKPVGTVWFAWAAPDGVHTELRFFEGDRHSIQEQATAHALAGLESVLQ